MLEVQTAALSDQGARSSNEDDLRTGCRNALWFAVLCDGAGGHRNGATASDIVARTAALGLQTSTAFSPAGLRKILTRANDALNQRQRGLKSHQRMHSTVVAVWIDAQAHSAVWAHCGDSRLYVLRRGQVRQLTRDDSLVQQMVDSGLINAEAGRNHAAKNQLVSALGMEEGVDIHACEHPAHLHDGDAFLLCTDGWWDAVQPHEMEHTLAHATDPAHWLDSMAQLVRERNLRHQDNYSAVGLWVGDPTESTRVGPL